MVARISYNSHTPRCTTAPSGAAARRVMLYDATAPVAADRTALDDTSTLVQLSRILLLNGDGTVVVEPTGVLKGPCGGTKRTGCYHSPSSVVT